MKKEFPPELLAVSSFTGKRHLRTLDAEKIKLIKMKTINELKITGKNWDDSWVELQKKLLVHRGNLNKPK